VKAKGFQQSSYENARVPGNLSGHFVNPLELPR
jgi:hypothetical protein